MQRPAIEGHRRAFLRLLAGSPLLANTWAQDPLKLTSPKDALSLMDFEAAARSELPPAHWGYMASGVDDDATLKINREGFRHFQLRPRRLVDVSKIDMKTEIFGEVWDAPIFLSPVGGQKMFHSEGEVAVARAAKIKNTVQILSSATSTAVEDVAKARGAPPWYQLYMPVRWEGTEKLVHR